MELIERLEDDVLVVEISGELMGGPETEKFRRVVDNAIERESTLVVVDLKDVSWMNSSGLGMLISALTSLRGAGGDLVLANLSERLQRPIQITKLDTVLKSYDSVSDAVTKLRSSS